MQYAIRSYDNPQCRTLEQFNEDVNKFSLLKKLLKSDKLDSEQVRLTLNNIVSLLNLFSSNECVTMMFFKVRPIHWHKLKTYLVFLGHMPEAIVELGVINEDIPECQMIEHHLKHI